MGALTRGFETVPLDSRRFGRRFGDHELETALTLLIHRKRPLLTAQIRLELARALALAGERASAVVEAEAALGIFHDLGVVPDINASHELLDELATGGAAIAREPATLGLRHPPGAVETLTRRESEVAGLVAQGMTNRELAQHLFLSVRTVETHVDRVLGKLGLHTRTQLAAWVQRNSR